MRFLAHEEIIISSGDNTVKLTNQRIQLRETSFGKSYQIEFFLEDISCIQSNYKIKHYYIIIAALGVLSSFALNGDQGIQIMLWVAAAVFAILWLFSRKHRIRITSNGGSNMDFMVSNMSEQLVQEFIFTLQEAKAKRREYLMQRIESQVDLK